MDTYYYCKTLNTPLPNVGGDCAEWVEVPHQSSLLPDITQEQANELGGAIIFCLLFAWGWKQLQSAF